MKTICLIDTNVILRFLIGDELGQKYLVDDFFKQIYLGKMRGLISILVVNEVLWILQDYYQMDKSIACQALSELLECEFIVSLEMKKTDLIELIKNYASTNLDITDLYLARTARLGDFWLATFDKKLQKRSILPPSLSSMR